MDLALLLVLPLVAWAMLRARHRKRLAALMEQRQLMADDVRPPCRRARIRRTSSLCRSLESAVRSQSCRITQRSWLVVRLAPRPSATKNGWAAPASSVLDREPAAPPALKATPVGRPRASELVGLTRGDVVLGTGAHIRCLGKGRKERATHTVRPVPARRPAPRVPRRALIMPNRHTANAGKTSLH
jgi:hypothetical protein